MKTKILFSVIFAFIFGSIFFCQSGQAQDEIDKRIGYIDEIFYDIKIDIVADYVSGDQFPSKCVIEKFSSGKEILFSVPAYREASFSCLGDSRTIMVYMKLYKKFEGKWILEKETGCIGTYRTINVTPLHPENYKVVVEPVYKKGYYDGYYYVLLNITD